MNIAEARSRKDGIDFFINEKNLTISAERTAEGKVVITKENYIKPLERVRNIKVKIMCFLLSLIIATIYSFIEKKGYGHTAIILLILALVWSVVFGYYLLQTKDASNKQSFRYHAAEHKALNFWDKYEKIPETVEDIMKMNSISWRCGSTVVAVVLLLVTLISLGFLFIPLFFLKIAWAALSVYLTMYLWANGKCNFFQKMVISEPSIQEVEVAMEGMKVYLDFKLNK